MGLYGYGQYGGLPDPYQVPENAGPIDFYEAMLNGQTTLEALDAAEHPQYQYLLDPATGQPVWVERIPMEQRMAPFVRRQMVRRLKMRLLAMIPPVLLIAWVALVLISPEPVGKWLQREFLPGFAMLCVWGGATAVVVWVVVQIVRSIVSAVGKNAPWKESG